MTRDELLLVVQGLAGIVLALLSYLMLDVRKDVRQVRDRMLIVWEWYRQNVGVANGTPETTYPAIERRARRRD